MGEAYDLEVGDRLQALPGIGHRINDKEVFREGDVGTVTKFYTDSKGTEAFKIRWDRNGLENGEVSATWQKRFTKASLAKCGISWKKAEVKLGTRVKALP